MTHDDLVNALRAIDGLVELARGSSNFHFRSRALLHFHDHPHGIYADVRLGHGDFEPVWVTTPAERLELLALVHDHVEHVNRTTKQGRAQSSGKRRRG